MKKAAILVSLFFLAACTQKKLTGPTPVVTDALKQDRADQNPRIMWNQAPTPVTVTGSRFTPMAVNTFSDKPGTKIPELFLVNATSSTRLQTPVWIDRQTMTAEIPSGIVIADSKGWEDFKIVARDPSGIRGIPGASFRVSTFQTPKVSGAQIGGGKPVARYCDTSTTSTTPITLTILGANFLAGAKVEFAETLTAASPAAATAAVTAVTGKSLVATIPAGQIAGDYDVRVTNVDGQIVVLQNVFTVEFYTCPPPDYTITAVTPRFAYRLENVMLQVDGTKFKPTPAITLRKAGYAVNVSYEAFLTDTTLQGLLYADASRQVGWYDLEVTNPADTTGATLAHALLVVDTPLPKIDTVSPDSLPGIDKVLTVNGSNFCDNACAFPADTTMAAFDTNGYVAGITSQTMSDSKIYVFFPGSATSGVFVLRVFKNITVNGVPEKVWADYSNVVVTATPSGNTDPFLSSNSHLVTARREFGLVGARNSLGSRFLYAVAGRTSNTDDTSGIATVDIAPIDIFGKLLPFYQSPITLGTTGSRFAPGLVEYGGWLYLVGGWKNAIGPVTEVLKAKVLDPALAPDIIDVTATSGTLAAGNWLYLVSAVKNVTDTTNPGETLPSVEVAQNLSMPGGVRLRWKHVTGALSYNVYRTDGTNATPQSEHLIANVSAPCPGVCSYTDGGVAPGTVAFLPKGALSAWIAGGQLNTPRSNLTVTIARNQFGTPFVYAMGGVNDLTGAPVNTFEYAAVTTGGNLNFVAGSRTMSSARRDAMSAVGDLLNLTATQITSSTLQSDWVMVMSGASTNFGSFLSSADNGQVQDSGDLGPFTPINSSLSTVAGGGAILASQTLFEFGGTNGSYDGTGSQSTVTSGLFKNFITNPSPKLALQSFNANPESLKATRSFFGYTRFNAQIFIVGGARVNPTSSLLEVTDTIETVYY